jgi:hypothetical protein
MALLSGRNEKESAIDVVHVWYLLPIISLGITLAMLALVPVCRSSRSIFRACFPESRLDLLAVAKAELPARSLGFAK